MSRSEPFRVRLVQMEVRPGHPAENTHRMLEHIRAAQTDHVSLLVFPELCVPGYLIGDEWEQEAFLRECEACTRDLVAASRGLAIIFGNVAVDWRRRNEDGRVRKYNALWVAQNGRLTAPSGGPYPFVIKTLSPNYRQFEEHRHFYDLRALAQELGCPLHRLIRPVRIGRLSVGCLLCEDAWDEHYATSPMTFLARSRVDFFVHIASSPYTVNKNLRRNAIYARHARRARRPVLYVNHVGIQNNGKTVFTFDGATSLFDPHGRRLQVGSPFEDAMLTLDWPFTVLHPCRVTEDTISSLYCALDYGTRRFLAWGKLTRVVVGISGGIDSSVVASIYRNILPPERLLLVNLPGPFTSRTTVRLARELAARLGCLYLELPIAESARFTRRQIQGAVARSRDGRLRQVLRLTDTMFENVQARDRSSRVLAAVAAAFGGVFTCNANKAESMVGYSTLYGDLAGFFANIADLWKHEVYELGRYLNTVVYPRAVIPDGVFTLTPTAELSRDQNADDHKGDPLHYPYHDRLFQVLMESWNRVTPEEILTWYAAGTLEKKLGYPGRLAHLFRTPAAFIADLERWWNQYRGMGLIKRIQAPPILALKRRAFGFDYQESWLGPYYTRRYVALKEKLLSTGGATR